MTESTSASGSVSRRTFVKIAAGAVAVGAAGAAAVVATRDKTTDRLVAVYRDDAASVIDPESDAWGDLPLYEAPLLPQQMTAPMLDQAAIRQLGVRSIHDGDTIAFYLEWGDDDADQIDAMHRFRDAVAIQLPTTDGDPPAVTMGQPDKPVYVLHWKGSWQADVDLGRQTVEDAFPNMYNDVRPEDLMGEDEAAVFYPGVYVGNSLSGRSRVSPVEELTAGGFGSLTTLEDQRASGRGVFGGGRWKVVMSIPMQGGKERANLAPGTTAQVAFAAWNGGHDNRGARKQWANWTPLAIEEGSV